MCSALLELKALECNKRKAKDYVSCVSVRLLEGNIVNGCEFSCVNNNKINGWCCFNILPVIAAAVVVP